MEAGRVQRTHSLFARLSASMTDVRKPIRQSSVLVQLLFAGLTASVVHLAPGCSAGNGHPSATPGREWSIASPAEEGMDETVLTRARDYAFQRGKNTQGVVVVRRGRIVAEWYEEGADENSWAASWSVAKSFTGALIGIAIDRGLIPGVDVSLAEYFPAWNGTDKAAITLEDLLTMSSGLDWVEDYQPSAADRSDIIRLVLTERDQLAYVIARERAREPGSRFNYSSGDTMLLSGVIEGATGMSAGEFARRELFAPLGIDRVDWWTDAEGHTLTYCCLDMTSRDFARFGLLYKRGGAWGGRSVVPAQWVADTTSPSRSSKGYGYLWSLTGRTDRRLPEDTFSANGFDGQRIYVIPSLDLVVVRSGRYIKYSGKAVADPFLYALYPSSGVNASRGTFPPDSWSDATFLTPIIDSITDGRPGP